ncbi:MAG: tetratricopeptide repeat protein, partial [Verrucomicrobiales bacterium]
MFRKQDRIDDLNNAFIKLAVDNPRRLLIHRQLAKIEAAQGETDSAVGRFREVLKRSPGNRELREEFVRLLTDGEKYQDAAEELEKLIKQAPDDAGLQLQMADLRHRQDNEKATLAALETARTLFPQNEPSGIRIASLMLQYGLAEQGEALLKSLADAANATPAPSEALAAEYARTNRKQEALAILEKVADSDQLDVVLRAAASISALGQTDSAHTILTAKSAAFPSEPRFLAALAQSALAAAKPDEAIPPATKLVRLATQSAELADATSLALRAITTAQKTIELRESLGKKADRTPSETCLLAALADSQNDFPAVTTLMHGATDPLVIRFHAALLDKRGDFPAAIATLSRLADTPEGRKTSFFREMSDLQRRAGLIEDALATVERWKQSAPGDKAAWVTGASLLRQAGRPEDAVQMTRQAVARFEGDSDLAASLASLHEEAGQMQDADAIYWRLYDDSASPSDQARWAAKLAQLSLRTGRTDELAEKLAQRARSNRGSVGPILAQAELARVTRNEEKRRDLLLEAVRLQPKDIDLRLQIANLEEQSGNPDRVIAILEEAADIDTTGRIRSALAQAYLRQGQVMKGMRELRARAGKQGEDPRTIEQSAASLAAIGLYEEAIRFLRESIPGGGDWRSRYLLAIMLEQDGRETEAIPLFQTLLQASGELAGRNAAANHPAPNVTTGWDPYGKQVASIIELMYAANAAYSHRDNNSYGNYGTRNITRVGPFALPDEPETARTLSRIHLAKLGVDDGQNSGFVAEILSASPQGRPDFPAMLAKYPEQPGLLEITLLYSSWGNQQGALTPETIRKALAKRPDLSASNRFLAYLRLTHGTEASDPVWQQLITAAADATTDPNSPEAIQIAFHLMNFLVQSRDDIPETHHKPLADTLLRVASSEKANEGMFRGFHLAAVKLVGTTDQLIAVINSEVENHRKDPANKNQLGMSLRTRTQISYSMGGSQYNPWLSGGKSPFSLPDLDDCNFTSLPASIIQMIRKSVAQFQQTIDPASLLDHLDSVSSPALRAWIALSAGDDAAAEKALAATPPDAETTDFNTLRAIRAIGQKDYPAAFRHFAATRPALSADRTVTTWLNLTLVAIASEMTPEQREAIHDPLRAMLIQCRQPLGTEGLPLLAAQAEKLGMPELAARFTPAVISRNSPNTPLGAARFGSRSSSGSSNSGNATIDKLKKFTADGKIEAAAMEALNLIRKLNRSSYSSSYERRQIRENINEEVLAELFRMIDPGDSKSLTKLMEYAGICEHFGKPEQALAVLRRLHADRPDDVSVSARLAFLLPPAERDLAIELITRSVKLPEFATFAATSAETLDDEENNASSFAWFETVISFLESADPTTIKDANLTWVAYYAKEFFTGDFTEDLPNLTRSISDNNKQHKDYQQFVSLAKRLAFAMHRHPSICEEGFRLIRVSNAWQIPDAEMDALARTVLLNASLTSTDTYSRYSFFLLRRGNGSSSSGDDLSANSSVKWLTDRLDNATSPDEILPAAYLGELTKTNPEVATIVSALANLTDIAGLETFWKSDALAKAAGPYAAMLRKGVLSRAAAIPGASSFFLKQLAEIKPGFLSGNSYYGNARESTATLLTAALSAGAHADTKELDAICKAVTTILFGEKIDFSDTGDGQATYTAINLMQNLLRTAEFPPATAARVYSAFHRLGTPISDSDYYLAEPFRGISIPNAAKGEAFFNSLGLLDDIDTWRPFAAIIAEANHTGNSITFTRSEKFILPEIASRMNWDINRSIMVKHLKNRKPRTFGALITAASLTDGNERSQLTATAFTNAAPQLAKLSPQRVADFALLIPWLPKDTLAKLPASFRQKADSANATRLASLIERADSFLKSPPANNYNSPLDEVEELVSELAPLDLDKAVAVFLEAERRFTASLTRGGRLSSYTSSGLQITERDEALSDLFSTYSETPFTTDPVLGLRFHAAIAASPEATRFSFVRSSDPVPLIFTIGEKIYDNAPGKTGPNDPRWLLAMRYVASMPEDVQKDAYLSLCTYLIGSKRTISTMAHPKERGALAKMKFLRKHFADLRGMC